jgi:hypothetical protein
MLKIRDRRLSFLGAGRSGPLPPVLPHRTKVDLEDNFYEPHWATLEFFAYFKPQYVFIQPVLDVNLAMISLIGLPALRLWKKKQHTGLLWFSQD